MKAVILAGGLGSRLSTQESDLPKPMTNIGGMPILWHIMKIYSSHGINDFIILCGYKSFAIKNFFLNYRAHVSNIEVDLREDTINFTSGNSEPWKIHLVETGISTMTGGRLKRVENLLNENFCLTYGDGVGNIDITSSIRSHEMSNKLVTVTAVHLPGRFGALEMTENEVTSFHEKPNDSDAWVNGGFFVVNPKALNLLTGDDSVWENEPLQHFAKSGELNAWKHLGFWKPMDTPRDVIDLNRIWDSGVAPWKTW
jgi:glucose-1-phosphate cytidylyltransferase